MSSLGKRLAIMTAALAAVVIIGNTSAAQLSYTRFGAAAPVSGGERLTSDLTNSDTSDDFSGLRFNLPVPVTFADVTRLETTQVPEGADDTCVGGSPRFQLAVDTDNDGTSNGNIFVNTELSGNCPSPTGDLAEVGGPGDIPGRYDTSQLIPGTQVSTYSATLAALGSARVLRISLVVDSGWALPDQEQSIIVNPTVEVNLPQPADKDDCKRAGWRGHFRADGTGFQNQGDCVQYVNTGK